MPRRLVSRFRPSAGGVALPGAFQRRLGALLMALAGASLAFLLLRAPQVWTRQQEQKRFQEWQESVVEEPEAVEQLFAQLPRPAPDFPGKGPELDALLEAHPTLAAVVSRREPRRVLLRQGEELVDAPPGLAARYIAWARQAGAAGVPKWNPPPELDPEAGRVPSLVLPGPDWTFIKRWPIGSPEVERHLRLALGPHPRLRLGVWRFDPAARGPAPADMGPFEPPHLQAWPGSPQRTWNISFTSSELGPDWEMICQPWPREAAAWDAAVASQRRIAWSLALAVALALLLGFWLWRRALRREHLAADRLAALTHSLKTPLALHKLRCDSLRMGSLGPARAREELLKLGQEVDELTRLIERSLQSLRGDSGHAEREVLGPGWFRDLAEELQPAFLDAGRELRLELAEAEGKAHEPSLRSALQTLLENAYHHGSGAALLRTSRQRGRLRIQVSDEGPGLDTVALDSLGAPFQRLRAEGQEGFAAPGQGLGLSLLFLVAKQEGWGLELLSGPGLGLTATLEVPG